MTDSDPAEQVWVATHGYDHEGALILGVFRTDDVAKAAAQADTLRPLEWSWEPSHPVDCWFARSAAGSYYEVSPWKVSP